MNIGNPPKPYFLDVDSGSDLTWLQCDAPCRSCNEVPPPRLLSPCRPMRSIAPSCPPIASCCRCAGAAPAVPANKEQAGAMRAPAVRFPAQRADREAQMRLAARAMRLRDQVRRPGVVHRRARQRQLRAPPHQRLCRSPQRRLRVGTLLLTLCCAVNKLSTAFAKLAIRFFNCFCFLFLFLCRCGYDQQVRSGDLSSPTDGVLGLGTGSVSLLSQLKQRGVTKNVVGHCLSLRGGGFLFFGDDLVPYQRATWTPMARSAFR